MLIRALYGNQFEEQAQAMKEDKTKKGGKPPPAKKEDSKTQLTAQEEKKQIESSLSEFEENPCMFMGEYKVESTADHSDE